MSDRRPRQCLFCRRASGDRVDPDDPTSPTVILTREHLFRSTWKDKLDVSIMPNNAPVFGPRKFTRYDSDNSIKQSRPEPLFEVVVKPVCNYCNNGWMNDLDTAVEPWLIEPDVDEKQCAPVLFRQWAIKLAVLRSYYESRWAPHPADFIALSEGRDLPEWHIFIGRSFLPNFQHSFAGFGPVFEGTEGRVFGITQVSWVIGHVLVIAIRLIGDGHLPDKYFRIFKNANRSEGIVVAEVSPTAKRLPSLTTLPGLSTLKVQKLVWYFTPNPLSPISEAMRGLEDGFKRARNQMQSDIDVAGERPCDDELDRSVAEYPIRQAVPEMFEDNEIQAQPRR